MDTSHTLTSYLACTFERSTRYTKRDKNKYVVFLDDMIAVQRQLDDISLNISHLIDRYRVIRPRYHEHNSSAARALEVFEPSNPRNVS